MKKILKVLFNIGWILFAGIEIAISEAIIGALCYATIIGIPLGKQHFKFIKLAFAPARKVIVTKFNRYTLLNLLYGFLGGFYQGIIYCFLGILLIITIIFAPVGIQLIKFSSFSFAPFGSEVINEYEFSLKKDTSYDIALLIARMLKDTSKTIENKNKTITIDEHINRCFSKHNEECNKYLSLGKRIMFLKAIVSFSPIVVMIPIFFSFNWPSFFIGLSLFILIMIITSIINKIIDYKMNNLFLSIFKDSFNKFDDLSSVKIYDSRYQHLKLISYYTNKQKEAN